MAQEQLDRFRDLVLQDSGLQAELRDILDPTAFVARVVELGRERGYEFSAAEVEAAMQAERRAWIERWIQ